MNPLPFFRAQRDLNNQLRREQELEYEQALQQDRKKKEERLRRESEHLENQKREEELLKQEEEKKQRLADIRRQIREEVNGLPEPQDGEIVRVSVRFPCGAKFDRRFGVTNSLEVSFFMIFTGFYFISYISRYCLIPSSHMKNVLMIFHYFQAILVKNLHVLLNGIKNLALLLNILESFQPSRKLDLTHLSLY